MNVIAITMESYYDDFIQPYTHKQLMALYEVSWMTLQKWLKPYEEEIGKKVGHFYSATQVAIIFARLGIPKGLKKQRS